MDLAHLLTPENLVALATLTLMEIVLGIDNIVFISVLAGKLAPEKRASTRRTGLVLALVMRLGLLLSIRWVMGLTVPLFTVAGHEMTGKGVILLVGGLFLIAKATHEIYDKLEGDYSEAGGGAARATVASVLTQIILLDIVFSLDSVITAVGMARELAIMVVAMLIAVGVMLVFAGAIGEFVNRHPSMKILALSFLILIGVMLTAEALGQHVGKGYIYSAMAFSLAVELLNMRFRKRHAPVSLHQPGEAAPPAGPGGAPPRARRADH